MDEATLAIARCDSEDLGDVEADSPARVTSTVTPLTRRRVYARDNNRCCMPGSRAARNLTIHHLEFQCEGGSHAISNLTLLCSGHHRLLHLGLLTITGAAPDALAITWKPDPDIGEDTEPSVRELLRANLDDTAERPARCARTSKSPATTRKGSETNANGSIGFVPRGT